MPPIEKAGNLIVKPLLSAARKAAWQLSVLKECGLHHHEDPYIRRITAIHRLLNIPSDYPTRGIALQRECDSLALVRVQGTHRMVSIEKTAFRAYEAMRAAAAADGVTVSIKWAYRSVNEQCYFILDRLRWGHQISELLTWVAAPGFSEHHTGRAIDIASPASDVPFETTPTFLWRQKNAANFDFSMSYPAKNTHGIIFEPWHWLHQV